MPPVQVDEEKVSGSGFTTTSYQFRDQALNSATAYIRTEGESRRHCFARLDKKHRVVRRSEDKKGDRVPVITVELMPPRHPPKAQYWDFFPPLRLIKVITDWIRRRELVQKQERVRGGKRKRNGSVRSEIPQEIM
jgi:putative membrane protein